MDRSRYNQNSGKLQTLFSHKRNQTVLGKNFRLTESQRNKFPSILDIQTENTVTTLHHFLWCQQPWQDWNILLSVINTAKHPTVCITWGQQSEGRGELSSFLRPGASATSLWTWHTFSAGQKTPWPLLHAEAFPSLYKNIYWHSGVTATMKDREMESRFLLKSP